ncbi:hypothetical protein HPB47_008858 [Ixodes persulcatus]|uniref:Uncharacterized protein n=1 Tax=Ixodes persulcatus TaxID=34615 RepID=A0AC60P3K1_IXOPE|nr:hypothetical protein HPB47_008858 [Ixodes persulcatus]
MCVPVFNRKLPSIAGVAGALEQVNDLVALNDFDRRNIAEPRYTRADCRRSRNVSAFRSDCPLHRKERSTPLSGPAVYIGSAFAHTGLCGSAART